MMVNMPAVLTAYYMKRELEKFLAENKDELMASLAPGDSRSARYDYDGQELPLGKATRTEPRPAWKITDEDALLAWAKENMPELTAVRTVLDEAAARDLMTKVKHQNGAFTDDGEVIPGITWDNSGGSHIRFTPSQDIAQKLALLNREGRLTDLTGEVLGIEHADAE